MAAVTRAVVSPTDIKKLSELNQYISTTENKRAVNLVIEILINGSWEMEFNTTGIIIELNGTYALMVEEDVRRLNEFFEDKTQVQTPAQDQAQNHPQKNALQKCCRKVVKVVKSIMKTQDQVQTPTQVEDQTPTQEQTIKKGYCMRLY